jgi:hypothetical protein
MPHREYGVTINVEEQEYKNDAGPLHFLIDDELAVGN